MRFFCSGEEIGPPLALAMKDGEWQAVVAMRDLLRDLYNDTPPCNDLRAREVAREYRLQWCKDHYQTIHLLYLEEDVTIAVANAACLGVGFAAVGTVVVEAPNAMVKRAYNHTGQGVGGSTALEREVERIL